MALTFLAATTSRIGLAFGVLVLPQRHPVLLAKQLASLDVLTAGRLTVGIGAGYVEPELEALGMPMSERGARTDEYLAAMQTLWSGTSDTPEVVCLHNAAFQDPSQVSELPPCS